MSADVPPGPPPAPPAAPVQRRKVHYIAASFYTLVTLVAVIVAFQGQPSTLFVGALTALYATYLFRGGRFVLWIW